MSQQYPQQPHVQFQPQPPVQPPKQKHTGRTILIVIGCVVGLLIVIGAVGGGGEPGTAGKDADNAPVAQTSSKAPAPAPKKSAEAPKASATAPAAPAAPKLACEGQDDRSAPCAVAVGGAFKLGEHTVLAGWKIKDNGYGTGMTIVGKAKNTGDKTSTMFIHVKFLKGDEVMANIMCNTGDLAPGQSEAMNCIPDGTYTRKFDKVTAEASF